MKKFYVVIVFFLLFIILLSSYSCNKEKKFIRDCNNGEIDSCITLATLANQRSNYYDQTIWLEKACHSKSAEACAILAEYELLNKSNDKARLLLNKAMDLKYWKTCQLFSGHFKIYDRYNKEDLQSLSKIYRDSCHLHDARGCTCFAYINHLLGSNKFAKTELKTACLKQSSLGCYFLGTIYLKEKQNDQAKYYFSKACSFGSGIGCSEEWRLSKFLNLDASKKVLKKACDLKSEDGCTLLAKIEEKTGNKSLAIELQNKAKELSNAEFIEEIGNGLPQYDELKALDEKFRKHGYEKILGYSGDINDVKKVLTYEFVALAICALIIILIVAYALIKKFSKHMFFDKAYLDIKLPDPPRTIWPKFFFLIVTAIVFFAGAGMTVIFLTIGISSEVKHWWFIALFFSIYILVGLFYFANRVDNHVYLARYGKMIWADVVAGIKRLEVSGFLLNEGEYIYKFQVDNNYFANSFELQKVTVKQTPPKILIAYDPTSPELNWPVELLAFKVAGVKIPSLITPDYFFTFQKIEQSTNVINIIKKFDFLTKNLNRP